MRFRITHRTRYAYSSPVHESFNEVRLRPASDQNQTCLDFALTIDPPASVIAFLDYYGNTVHDFSVPYQHSHLNIEAVSDVITFDRPDPVNGTDGDRSPMLAGLTDDEAFANDQAEFLIPSTYVALDDDTLHLARNLLATDPEISAYGFLRAASAFIGERLTYQVGTTTVHSTVAEVLAGGSGVCQDFSHVLITLCRHAGLPARYVSGYLGNVSAAEASHAWVEAFVPPYGWVGFDPTSGTPCAGRHIKIAVGRDYADVAVARGTYRGGHAQELEVSVTSEVIDDTRGIVMGSPYRRGELIQYQTLGGMRQFQRLGAMVQQQGLSAGVMTTDELATGVTTHHPDIGGEIPRQQPQQQQQLADTHDQDKGHAWISA
jgi:transglutaminase-like putative cysteine protease